MDFLNQLKLTKFKLNPNHEEIISITFVTAVVALVYFPIVNNGFVWDDSIFLKDFLRDSFSIWSWGKPMMKHFIFSQNYFRPIGILSFLIELHFEGLNAKGFHIANLFLHLFNIILLMKIMFSMFQDRQDRNLFSLILLTLMGIFYGLHPALVEGVAFISSRFDLLMTTFLLLSLISNISLKNKLLCAFITAFFYLLALGTKEMAFPFPLILFFLHISRKLNKTNSKAEFVNSKHFSSWRDFTKQHFITYLALLSVFAIYSSARVYLLGNFLNNVSINQINFRTFFLLIQSLSEYIKLAISPFFTLSPLHIPQQSPYHLNNLTLQALFITILYFFLIAVLLKKNISIGILFGAALISLTPVLNIIPLHLNGNAIIAERYLLFPIAILTISISSFFFWIYTKGQNTTTNGKININPFPLWHIILVILLFFWVLGAGFTVSITIPHWRNEMSLWQWTSKQVPFSGFAHSNFAISLSKEGFNSKALLEANKAVNLSPSLFEAWNNLGVILLKINRPKKAKIAYEQALKINPNNPQIWINIAGILALNGKTNEAINILKNKALLVNPNFPGIYINLAYLYFVTKDYQAALNSINIAEKLLPPTLHKETQALKSQILKAKK